MTSLTSGLGSPPVHSSPACFSQQELDAWKRDGYIIVRRLADERMMDEMREEIREALARLNGPIEYEADVHYPGAPESRDSEGGNTVLDSSRRIAEGSFSHSGFSIRLLWDVYVTSWDRLPVLSRITTAS
ncbi:MAG: hypothetical protein R3B91_08760 [Planctomycetaceae bacterium]